MKEMLRRESLGTATATGRGLLTIIVVAGAYAAAAEPTFLRRSATEIRELSVDLSSATAHYKPMFGVEDPNAHDMKGIMRFGELAVEPGGSSTIVSYEDTEGVLFTLAGNGILHYGQEKVPIRQNDFVYLPVGVKHEISNQSEKPLRLLVMGFKISAETEVRPTLNRMMANADDVPLQVLASHGPTTQFKLLMGTTESKRDKLAVAQQINSLFLMDFASGGTNIPHRHNREEEIYYVLHGRGDMVAGSDATGKEMRYPSRQGDAFYFSRGTLIGFYSGMEDGEEHAQILAVRWPVPSAKSETSPNDTVKR